MERRKIRQGSSLDIRCLAMGFLAGLCVILTIGAAFDDGPGRYQCCAAGNDSTAVFIVDTRTGQAWRLGRTDVYNFGTPQEPRSVRRSIRPMVD